MTAKQSEVDVTARTVGGGPLDRNAPHAGGNHDDGERGRAPFPPGRRRSARRGGDLGAPRSAHLIAHGRETVTFRCSRGQPG